MSKQEEQKVFDMAKQDVPFLKNLELITHDDRPDFVLKDKCGCKIGLEHFRADVYRVQDKNSSHISGGHTILNNSFNEVYQKYHPIEANNEWNDKLKENSLNEFFNDIIKNSFNMRSNYTYEDFLNNIHVTIHGRPSKVKGHVLKSKYYPDRKSFDLMGFLIEIPVPLFHYYFETIDSQQKSKSKLYPLDSQEHSENSREYNEGYSYQKINGLPITNEIWKEINIFEDIDFIIIETYEENCPQKHYGQFFDKNTAKPRIYPAFSFGFTNITFNPVQTNQKDGKIIATFPFQANCLKDKPKITKTKLKAERRKQSRKTRKNFDEAAKNMY